MLTLSDVDYALIMQHQNMHHGAHFLVYNVLAKFQLFCIITCRDILYFVFWLPYCHTSWRHQYLICIIQKPWICLERDEIWQKGKHHSSSLLKAFQIRLFFNTSIFHFIGTLNQHHSSLARHVNVTSRKSLEIQAWSITKPRTYSGWKFVWILVFSCS